MDISELQSAIIKKARVLIVDDLPENLQILGNTLREEGFQIAFATSGKQALKIAEAKMPDLILLDLSMPEMDGITVCKKLKENPTTNNIPIIFLTARTDSENIMKALSAGAIDYVVKPFIAVNLLERIFTHLGINKTNELSEKEKDISVLKTASLLEREYIPRYNEVKAGMFIDDILEFSKSIKKIGVMNRIKQIIEYSDVLHQHAESLNIAKMTEILDQFPVLIKKITTRE